MKNKIKQTKISNRNIWWKAILIAIAAIILPCLVMAQATTVIDPGCGADCPIDGGLSVLLAAGVGYGVKKYREGRKKAINN